MAKLGESRVRETDSSTQYSTASATSKEQDLTNELRQIRELISKMPQSKPSHSLANAGVTLYRTLATHVLLLLLGISLTAWWAISDDSWRSYVKTGCQPSAELYSQRYIPDPYPIKKGATYADLLLWQEERINQLVLTAHNLLLDRDSIRAVCGDNDVYHAQK
jgi:hypothetical protein